MKVEQINANAKVRQIDDTMIELGLPELAPVSLFPGAISKIRTGVKLTLEPEEAAVIAFTQPIAEAGVTLAHPRLITESTDGELTLSVFNRSGFVKTLEPDKPLCAIVTIARGEKIVGNVKRLEKAVAETTAFVESPSATPAPKQEGHSVRRSA